MSAPHTAAPEDALGRLAAARVVPVLVLDDADAAVQVGSALLAGGVDVAEVTFRTAAAEEALAAVASVPGVLAGAGTVLDADQVDRAVAAGARFVVSPGLDADVVRRCRDHGVPVLPGIATATELMQAAALGLTAVKLFPAEPLGGVRAVSALSGPFPDIRFVPTGGIDAASFPSYLSHPSVLAVGGSWMAPASLVRSGAWDRIAALAAESSAAARTTEVSR